jgi:hypothetical protein
VKLFRSGPAALALVSLVAIPAVAADDPPLVEFDIKLPPGFTQIVEKAPPGRGTKAVGYRGPEQKDGSETRLVVMTMRLPPEARQESPDMIIERMVTNLIQDIRKQLDIIPYKRKDTTLNGMRVARMTWDGKRPDGKPTTVLGYLGSIGNAAVIMRAECIGPGRKQAVATIDKALQTFSFQEMAAPPPLKR